MKTAQSGADLLIRGFGEVIPWIVLLISQSDAYGRAFRLQELRRDSGRGRRKARAHKGGINADNEYRDRTPQFQ